MDNMYTPPGGGFENRTQPPPQRRGPSRTTRWAAGLGVAALLIGGSVVAANLGGSPTTAAATALAGYSQPSGTSQAATLSSLLGSPASATATVLSGGSAGRSVPAGAAGALRRCAAVAKHLRATGHRAAARAKWRSCVRRFLRLRLRLLRGMHGQITFKTKHGVRTIAFERGVIQSVSSSAIVVKAADGTTWTWDLIAKTVVFHARHRASTHALATGERVFVAGPVVSGADDARLIVIRR
jgi:hypothetical protein